MRVEEDHPEDDRDSHDAHSASVGELSTSGQVFVGVNGVKVDRNQSDVVFATPVLALQPGDRAAPTRPHTPEKPKPVPAAVGADDDVVRRAAAGDTAAFRTLFDRHKSDVARLVWRMLNAPADLDDVVQEVFVQVFRSLKDFRGQSKFSTWLHRVTVNVVLMHRRSARSRPVLTEEAPSDLVSDDGQTLPDEDAERRERVRAFQRLLARLAEKKRLVFILHELEGLSPAEISEIVGAPVLTVRTRLFYARRELEAMLRDEPSLAALTALVEKGGAP